MKLSRLAVLVFIVGAMTLLFSNGPSPAHVSATHSIPVTVTITRAVAIGGNLEGIGRGSADLYVGVDINGGGRDAGNSFATHQDNNNDVRPFWTITRMVTIANDASPGSIPISMQVWEHDDCGTAFCTDTGILSSDDDAADTQPGGGGVATFSIDLATGRWTGSANWPQNCVQGDGDTAARLCFDISIDSASGDADGDFLLDGWERNGFDADGDGVIDVDLPGMGANVGRKDLFLELDCLVDNASNPITLRHTHCPTQPAMRAMVQSFANSPVPNVDGTSGIQLHIDVGTLYGATFVNVVGTGGVTGTVGNHGGGGNQIPEAGNLIVDWDGSAGSPATNFYTLKTANFNPNRALIFRYGIFVHQTNARAASNDCTSGWAEGVTSPGNDLLVSLGGVNGSGNACWGTDANGNSVGTQNEQAGTLMHEFGHTVALAHGGGDGVNNKPNYLSVMNYTFQACSVTASGPLLPGGCDFSRDDLNDLFEAMPPGLDECQGLDGGLYGLGPVNWNGDGTFAGPFLDGTSCPTPNAGNYSRNINGDFNDADGDSIQDPGEAATISTLAGFDDWANIRFDFRAQSSFGDGGVPPFPNEANPETIAVARAAFATLVRPELSLVKTGPANAIPGDTLSYGLNLRNVGDGPALQVSLTDTKPDATVLSFSIGTLTAGAQALRNLTFLASCALTDGAVVTNSATATAVDMLGNPFSASHNVATTIHAPVLTLTKTATSSVAAGEAITYTITYANTASGGATNVVIVDKLPTGVYYSAALNQGTGPAPSTAILTADGRWTLTWNVASLVPNSGPQTIQFTARPSLLFTGGQSLVNNATLSFTNANGCTYNPVTASAATTIVVIPPTRNPGGIGYWRNTPSQLTSEILARIQATDQRFDGEDGTTPDGRLSLAEVAAALVPGGNMDKVLKEQLLGTYANLATRRFNANTKLDTRLTTRLGLRNVAEAALYGINTLKLPVNSSTRSQFSDATTALDQANNNRGLLY